jgi:hypothetical protein
LATEESADDHQVMEQPMSNFQTIHDLVQALETSGPHHHYVVDDAIEAMRRWIYRENYKNPDKEPTPRTEGEFTGLIRGLTRWATLFTQNIDTGRLQDYRRAELELPTNPFGSARVFPDALVEREWKQGTDAFVLKLEAVKHPAFSAAQVWTPFQLPTERIALGLLPVAEPDVTVRTFTLGHKRTSPTRFFIIFGSL